jgi:NAD(P)-dependent dehydrogenase (short-subunit alcohol dehydrogenase family)
MNKLAGKVAIVTGGSSGIGLAIAQRFTIEGAKVAITGRNQKALDAAALQLGSSAITLKGDVSVLGDLDRIYKAMEPKLGKVDVLVVNAGVYALGSVVDFTEEQFDRVSDINFKGAFFSVQKALPLLKDGASIILVSSTVNGKGIPNHSAYSATKAAVRSLARSFSADLLSRKIRVNVLSPGPIDTPVFGTVTNTADEAKAMANAMGDFTPVKRLGTADEIAGAALFLASDESTFMLGAEVLLDGGIREL